MIYVLGDGARKYRQMNLHFEGVVPASGDTIIYIYVYIYIIYIYMYIYIILLAVISDHRCARLKKYTVFHIHDVSMILSS